MSGYSLTIADVLDVKIVVIIGQCIELKGLSQIVPRALKAI